MDDCLDLESKPELVAAAREFVRTRLAAWEMEDYEESAVLVASELVTNAVLHARTSIQLRLAASGATLRIEVFDENPRQPAVAQVHPEATSGRGLTLVSTVAAAWGIDNRGDGKVVWAEIGGSPSKPAEDCVDLSGIDTVEQAIGEVRRTKPDPGPSTAEPEPQP